MGGHMYQEQPLPRTFEEFNEQRRASSRTSRARATT